MDFTPNPALTEYAEMMRREQLGAVAQDVRHATGQRMSDRLRHVAERALTLSEMAVHDSSKCAAARSWLRVWDDLMPLVALNVPIEPEGRVMSDARLAQLLDA